MRRPLSQIERLAWCASEDKQSNFAMVVRIRGAFSIDQLLEALARVKARHPLLAVRVGEPSFRGGHFLSEGVPNFSVRVIDSWTEEAWTAVFEEEMQRPFSFQTGPLMRFALLRSPEVSDLVILGNHAIADGLGLIYLVRDILQQLGDPTAVPAALAVVPPMESLLPPVNSKEAAGSRGRDREPPGPARGPLPSGEPDRHAVLTWNLSRDDTSTLCARCRAEQTTVHAAIGAAFLGAFAELDPSAPIRRVQTPVNLRARLSQPVGEAFGCYMTHVETAVDCSSGHSFWEIARAFKRQLDQQIATADLFLTARRLKKIVALLPNVVLRWGAPLLIKSLKIRFDLSLSNLGRLDIPLEYGPLRIEALYASLGLLTADHRLLVVMKVGEQICFTFVTRDRALSQQLKERGMRRLRAALAAPS